VIEVAHDLWVLHAGTNWKYDVFAQASSSRLNKNTRNSSMPSVRIVA